MAYASEPLYRLGGTARNVGLLMFGITTVIFIRLADDMTTQLRTLVSVALLGMLPAALMVGLSFPVRRGRLWAACAMLGVVVCQLPSMIFFSGACCSQFVLAYLLTRCIIAWPEIVFQIRAARRAHAHVQRGFEPLVAAPATVATGPAVPVAVDPARPLTPRPPPTSLKPRSARPRRTE